MDENPRPGETVEDVLHIPADLEGVDVHRIMEEIQKRVEERREAGVYRDLPLADLDKMRLGDRGEVSIQDPLHEIIFNVELARHFAVVSSYYPIGARRTPLGPFILLAKKVLRRFMTPYMDAVFEKQRRFNAQVLQALEVFREIIERERERSYRSGVDRYYAWVELGLGETADDCLEEAATRFPPGRKIVNLWCGKGDFLEAAVRKGQEALGVEEDPRLVRICQERKLRVREASPLDFLEAAPADSLSAVFLQDLGERGRLENLLWVLGALASRLEKDGLVVILNHHPRSVLGTEEAFIDPSLERLVHPETMRAFIHRAGFREVEVSFLGFFGEEEKKAWLDKLEGGLDLQRLGEALFAPRRYLVQARR